MKLNTVILTILLGSMLPAVAMGKEHSMKSYMASLISSEAKMAALSGLGLNGIKGGNLEAAHLVEQQDPIELPDLDKAKVSTHCKFKDVETQIQCFVNHVGETVSNDEVKQFDTLVDSKFTRTFVSQKLLSKFLPEDQLANYLPDYFTIFSGRAAGYSGAIQEEIKKCENGFVLHWFDSSDISKDDNGVFKHFGQFFAADCRDKSRIVVNFFEGYRRGFFKKDEPSDEDREFVKRFCKETMVYMVSRHFGLAKSTKTN